MKRLSIFLCAMLLLAGCSNTAKNTGENEIPESNTTLKAGIAAITSFSTKDVEEGTGSAQFDTTYASVVLDSEGVIKYVHFDVAQNTATLDAEGIFTTSNDTRTKKEKGSDYGMSKASSLGKDWYEQIAHLENNLVGKNINDVLAMELESGKSTDVDILSGCTISVNDYYTALELASNNATEVENVAKVGTGSTTTLSATNVSEGAGSFQANTTFALILTDAEGKIVFSAIDTAQNTITVDGEGKFTAPENGTTKKSLAENYGMIKASSIGKEWFEQIAHLETFTLGKSIADVLATDSENTDLTSGCTISIEPYMSAIEAASNTLTDLK